MTSQKYAYADDLALLYASRDWKAVEDTLSQDMTTLSACLQTWRLKLSNTTTVTAVFHLNNKEDKRELNVYSNGNLLPPCPVLTYLGVELDRSLTFRHHFEALRKKLSTRVALLRHLWDPDGVQVPRHSASLLFPWSTSSLSTAHQFGVVVRILASLTAFSMMLCALSLDACVPHQRRTFLPSQASSQLSSADQERHSPWRIVLSIIPIMYCTNNWLQCH